MLGRYCTVGWSELFHWERLSAAAGTAWWERGDWTKTLKLRAVKPNQKPQSQWWATPFTLHKLVSSTANMKILIREAFKLHSDTFRVDGTLWMMIKQISQVEKKGRKRVTKSYNNMFAHLSIVVYSCANSFSLVCPGFEMSEISAFTPRQWRRMEFCLWSLKFKKLDLENFKANLELLSA